MDFPRSHTHPHAYAHIHTYAYKRTDEQFGIAHLVVRRKTQLFNYLLWHENFRSYTYSRQKKYSST